MRYLVVAITLLCLIAGCKDSGDDGPARVFEIIAHDVQETRIWLDAPQDRPEQYVGIVYPYHQYRIRYEIDNELDNTGWLNVQMFIGDKMVYETLDIPVKSLADVVWSNIVFIPHGWGGELLQVDAWLTDLDEVDSPVYTFDIAVMVPDVVTK